MNHLKILILSFCFFACGGSCDSENGSGGGALDSPYVGQTETQWSSVSGNNILVRLLTPEQISNQIYQTLGVRLGWEDEYGNFNDLITRIFAVPLGGVDYLTSQNRDFTPKINNLLLVRVLAWIAAAIAVNNEAGDEAVEDPVIFTECDVRTDRPFMSADTQYPAAFQQEIRSGEMRWKLQVESLYYRIFARAPTTAEIAAIRETFVNVIKQEEWPPSGWMVVIYAMLSTAEYWNI